MRRGLLDLFDHPWDCAGFEERLVRQRAEPGAHASTHHFMSRPVGSWTARAMRPCWNIFFGEACRVFPLDERSKGSKI